MTTHDEFIKLLNYKTDENEIICSSGIASYVESKYNVKVYKCVFEYDAYQKMNYILIYLNTTEGLNKIPTELKNLNICDMPIEFQNIIKESDIEFKESLWIMFRSFELEAVCDCYRNAFSNYWPFKAKYFNGETMDNIWNTAMFVILDDWLIPCWEYIKANCKETVQTYSEALLHSLNHVKKPTLRLLDLFAEVVKHAQKQTFVHVKIESLVSFFEVDAIKTADFIYSYFELDGYIRTEDIKTVLEAYKKHGLERKGSKLLIMLSKKGEISNLEKEQLANSYL